MPQFLATVRGSVRAIALVTLAACEWPRRGLQTRAALAPKSRWPARINARI